jgi:flagellar hook-associated protein 1
MANISGLYTALSGMQAQRKVMDITAHNVSNASTEGYHRQRVELASSGARMGAGIFAGRSTMYGVDVIGVSRSVDELLEARSVREEAGRAAASLANSTFERIEGVFAEPTDNGLASQLQAFWGAWTDVANNPGGLAQRTALLQAADTLASSLHRTADDLQSVKDTAIAGVVDLSKDANELAEQIASINKKIVGAPESANDLRDQRELLVNQLSQLTGAQARAGDNGQVDVYIGGRAVVAGQLSFALDGTGGTLRWASDGAVVTAPSGKAATLAATITDIVPRYTASLDSMVNTLVTQVNLVHNAGYDQSSTTGRDFFDPANVTAASISLSVDVAGLPQNVAAGAPVLPGPTAPGALDGEQARAIARIAESTSGPDSEYRALVSSLAVESRAALRRADIQDQIADATRAEADSIGGVSIDEEMANLTASQRAFEASARVLTIVDEMLGTVINMAAR